MSYVRANTSPTFGSRAQALRPLHLSGWFRGPYPVYGQPASIQLNGQFRPITRPSGSAWDGTPTFRVNPATGERQIYTTDIRPRGVFPQGTFQHPQQLSALGVRIATPATQMGRTRPVALPAPHPSAVRRMRGAIARRQANQAFATRVAREPMVPLLPGLRLSGCSSTCHCGGRCNHGLGDAPTGTQMQPYGIDNAGNPVFIDDAGNVYDADGNLMTDLSGVNSSGTAAKAASGGTWSGSGPAPGNTGGGSTGQQIINAVNQVSNAVAPNRQAVLPTATPGFFDAKTMVAGYAVPTVALYGIAGLIGLYALGGGSKRR